MNDKEQYISMKEMLTKRGLEPITNCNCKEEMARIMCGNDCEECAKESAELHKQTLEEARNNKCLLKNCAKTLYEQGLVVLSKEELSKRDYEFRQIGYDDCVKDSPKKDKYIETLERKIDQINAKFDQARKETAEKIFNDIFTLINNAKDKSFKIFGNCSDYGKGYKSSVNHFNEHILELAKQFGVEIKGEEE